MSSASSETLSKAGSEIWLKTGLKTGASESSAEGAPSQRGRGRFSPRSTHCAVEVRPKTPRAAAEADAVDRAICRRAAVSPGCGRARRCRPGNCRERPRASPDRARFDRRLGLSDILEKGKLAVKAPPAAGLEQFGEVLQPLLGKSRPARDDVTAARHVESVCHEPARKEKNGRRRNRHESI